MKTVAGEQGLQALLFVACTKQGFSQVNNAMTYEFLLAKIA